MPIEHRPARACRRARWPMLLVLWLLATAASAAPRIGVMTMQPGEIFWERFGHDAIVVADPALGAPVSYNFGFFDLDEPGFLGRFVDGVMEYQLVALPLAQDLQYYREVGRGVSIQWLDLDEAEATRLAAMLAHNARPENARYRYDYFTDNCATRVRDALDGALDGQLKRQLDGRSHGTTYRSDAVRLASPATWMWLGFDVGLGPAADRPLSLWQEAFVPMRLAAALREVKGRDGRALVAAEEQWLPHRLAPEPRESAPRWWPWLACGLLLAGIAWIAARRAPRMVAACALPLWGLCVLLGALMLFVWLYSAHRFAWANHNLLLFNPLCLLLLPGGWRIARGGKAGPWFGRWLVAVAACAALALFVLWLPLAPQRNAHWVALLLPLHVGLLLALRRR